MYVCTQVCALVRLRVRRTVKHINIFFFIYLYLHIYIYTCMYMYVQVRKHVDVEGGRQREAKQTVHIQRATEREREGKRGD